MSYTRWSTDIKNTVPMEEWCVLLLDGGIDALKAEQEKRGAVLSDWYIFWHCGSGEDDEEPLLALWNHTHTPTLSYEAVKDMYDNDDWSLFENTMTQKEHMKTCVKQWLDDVEEEEHD